MLIRNCEPKQGCTISSCKVLNTPISQSFYKISFHFTNQLFWKEQKRLCWCVYSIRSYYYLIYQGFTVSAVFGQEIFSPTHCPSLQPLGSMESSRNTDDTTPWLQNYGQDINLTDILREEDTTFPPYDNSRSQEKQTGRDNKRYTRSGYHNWHYLYSLSVFVSTSNSCSLRVKK